MIVKGIYVNTYLKIITYLYMFLQYFFLQCCHLSSLRSYTAFGAVYYLKKYKLILAHSGSDQTNKKVTNLRRLVEDNQHRIVSIQERGLLPDIDIEDLNMENLTSQDTCWL